MLTIEYRPIESLIPYARNSRTHSDEQVAQIASSIKEFGFVNPILIDQESIIIAGHGRLLAAQRLKIKEVPIILLDKLTEAQRKALVIADNRIALNAGWDYEMLSVELDELKDDGFNITLLGLSDKELDELIGSSDEIEEETESPIDENRNLLLVECIDERELEKLFGEMNERGYNCKIMS